MRSKQSSDVVDANGDLPAADGSSVIAWLPKRAVTLRGSLQIWRTTLLLRSSWSNDNKTYSGTRPALSSFNWPLLRTNWRQRTRARVEFASKVITPTPLDIAGARNYLPTTFTILPSIETIDAMAEPIGIASGLLALASFAFQSSITLYQTVQSFKFHPKQLRDLKDESLKP